MLEIKTRLEELLTERDSLASQAASTTFSSAAPERGLDVAERLLEIGDSEAAHTALAKQSALLNCEDVRTKVHFAFLWAVALYRSGRWAELERFTAQVPRLLPSEETQAESELSECRGRLMMQSAWALLRSERVADAQELVASLIRHDLGKRGFLRLLADISHFQAYRAFARGTTGVEPLRETEKAVAIRRTLQDWSGLSRALTLRCVLLKNRGELARAQADANEALECALKLGNLNAIQDSLRHLAILQYRQGRFHDAKSYADTGIALNEGVCAPASTGTLYLTKAYAQARLGECADAHESIDLAEQYLLDHAERNYMCILYEYRAMVLLEEGKPEEALEQIDLAEALFDDLKVVSYEKAEITLRRTHALIAMTRYAEAFEVAKCGLDTLPPGDVLERGYLCHVAAVAAHFIGKFGLARTLLSDAEVELRRVGDAYELGGVLVDIAELISSKAEQAVISAAEAVGIFDRLKTGRSATRARDVLSAARIRLLKEESVELVPFNPRPTSIVAESPAMKAVLSDCQLIAATDGVALVTGETGVGKEVVARFIHESSDRSEFGFVAINCAAIPEALFERELFGHVKGAFTGADSDRPGLVEAANKGTLFLDEVGDLPLHMQAKTLRLLQEGTYRRVGDVEERMADVRFVAATNTELEVLVQKKAFREDLYYRLRWFDVHVPPLRERTEDIKALTEFFLGREMARLGRSCWIHQNTWKIIKSYSWPGNVRELEAVVCVALVRSGDCGCIRVDHLPKALRERLEPLRSQSLDLAKELRARERNLILEALRRTRNSRKRAADLLGISRNTLYDKMIRLGIRPDSG